MFSELEPHPNADWLHFPPQQVGTLKSGVLALTTPIVYPGGFTLPPNQFRVGMLYTDTAAAVAAAAAATPFVAPASPAYIAPKTITTSGLPLSIAAVAGAQAVLGAQLAATAVSSCGVSRAVLQQQQRDSLYFAADNAVLGGRDSLVVVAAQTRTDDCAQTPALAFAAVRQMLRCVGRGWVSDGGRIIATMSKRIFFESALRASSRKDHKNIVMFE